MTDTIDTATDEPTGWFLHAGDGGYTSAARWYWPPSTVIEVYNPQSGDWQENQGTLWERVQEEPDWESVDQAQVEEWIASQTG